MYKDRHTNQIRTLNTFRLFEDSSQRISISSLRDEEKMCKGRLTDKENVEKKKRREVSKWVRRQGLTFGSGQDTY